MTISRTHHKAGTEPLSLQEIKTWCRVDHDDEDLLLTGLADSARDFVEQYTGRAIIPQTVSVLLDNVPAGRTVPLPRLPVSATPNLALTVYASDGTTTAAQGFVIGDLLYSTGSSFPAGERLHITYSAGYVSVPGNLRTAMLMLIAHWYENREAVLTGTITSQVPLHVTNILRFYRVHYHVPR